MPSNKKPRKEKDENTISILINKILRWTINNISLWLTNIWKIVNGIFLVILNTIWMLIIAIVTMLNYIRKRVSGSNIQHIMLIFSFITIIFAGISAYYSSESSQEAKNTTKLAGLSLDKTTEIAKWYYDPQPQMNILANVDYELNNEGFVYVDEWVGYTQGNGFNILSDGTILSGYVGYCGNLTHFYQAPSYLRCCKNIKIVVYNSGRQSIIFPLISFDLEAKNKTDGILFKVHTVRTSIDKLEYNAELKCMFESHKFVENQKIEMPYRAINNDFPPYLDENGNSYFVPPDFSKELLPYNLFANPWKERSDTLGPFRIGTIPPGESAEIELKIFSAKGWFSSINEKRNVMPSSTEETCKEGILNITVQSLNTDTNTIIINLKTGSRDTCKRMEEYDKLNV